MDQGWERKRDEMLGRKEFIEWKKLERVRMLLSEREREKSKGRGREINRGRERKELSCRSNF